MTKQKTQIKQITDTEKSIQRQKERYSDCVTCPYLKTMHIYTLNSNRPAINCSKTKETHAPDICGIARNHQREVIKKIFDDVLHKKKKQSISEFIYSLFAIFTIILITICSLSFFVRIFDIFTAYILSILLTIFSTILFDRGTLK